MMTYLMWFQGLAAWFCLAVIVGLFAGAFIRVGMGDGE